VIRLRSHKENEEMQRFKREGGYRQGAVRDLHFSRSSVGIDATCRTRMSE